MSCRLRGHSALISRTDNNKSHDQPSRHEGKQRGNYKCIGVYFHLAMGNVRGNNADDDDDDDVKLTIYGKKKKKKKKKKFT